MGAENVYRTFLMITYASVVLMFILSVKQLLGKPTDEKVEKVDMNNNELNQKAKVN